MLSMLTALLLTPFANPVALEKALKASLPDGWTFVSGRIAEFGGHHAKTCWLATLEAKKAGDFYLVAAIDHDPKTAGIRGVHTICRYHLGVGKVGTKRSVADPFALPQCNVGDRLVIPIPVAKGDIRHEFSFTMLEKRRRWHILGWQYRDQVMGQKDEKPAFKIDNKAEKHLRVVTGVCGMSSMFRWQRPPFDVREVVTFEAVRTGKFEVQAPIEIVGADAKVTGWVAVWDQSRLRERPAAGDDPGKKGGGTHRFEFTGPLVWTMRIGDRIRLTFPNGMVGSKDAKPPDLTVPMEKFVEAKEPYPSWR